MSKRITEKRFYNITLAYLSRFDASAGKVRSMLNRRLKKAQLNGEDIPAEAPHWIETIIGKMQSLGYLNDRRYAENQVRILSHQGKSQRFIAQKLTQAGISHETIQDLLTQDEVTDLDRAHRFVARKKIGPYRSATQQEAYRQKDLSALARAGFSYDIARQALEIKDEESTWID